MPLKKRDFLCVIFAIFAAAARFCSYDKSQELSVRRVNREQRAQDWRLAFETGCIRALRLVTASLAGSGAIDDRERDTVIAPSEHAASAASFRRHLAARRARGRKRTIVAIAGHAFTRMQAKPLFQGELVDVELGGER